jgi:uncharacterized membrane protein
MFLFFFNNFFINKRKFSPQAFFDLSNFCKKISREKEKKFVFWKKNNISQKKYIKNGVLIRKNVVRESLNDQMISVLSIFGMSETFYLSLSKIKNSIIICNVGTCSNVLNSVFSEMFHIPISFFGFFFYFFLLLTIKNEKISKRFNCFNYFLFFFGTLGLYFTSLLEIIFKINCQWCILSILFTSSILFTANLKQNSHFLQLNLSIGIVFITFVFLSYVINFTEIYFLYNNIYL